MTALSVATHGAKEIEKRLEAERLRIKGSHDDAAKAAATALVPFVRAALPRKKGNLRRQVHVYRVSDGVYKTKVTGPVAHLVLGDTKAHEISPRGMEAAQSAFHVRSSGRRVGGFAGPALMKRAIVIGGHPYAHAIHPAHRGDPGLLLRVREEHGPEAASAAKEVLRHGR